jgi:hypothetical protein
VSRKPANFVSAKVDERSDTGMERRRAALSNQSGPPSNRRVVSVARAPPESFPGAPAKVAGRPMTIRRPVPTIETPRATGSRFC